MNLQLQKKHLLDVPPLKASQVCNNLINFKGNNHHTLENRRSVELVQGPKFDLATIE